MLAVRRNVMSERLHLIASQSDALAIVKLLDYCIWCRCHQMHADDCLFFKGLKAQQLFDCKIRCSQNATSFAMKCQRFCTWCWDRRMHWRNCLFFQSFEAQRLSVNAGKASDACWYCRLTDWLQSKLLTDQSKCWFLANDDCFSLIWLQNLVGRDEIWLVCDNTSIFDRSSNLPN